MKRVVSFDLGSLLVGWALGTEDGVHGGVLALGKSNDLIGLRLIRLERAVGVVLVATKPTVVVYEEVKRHMGTYAAQVYGMTLATLILGCERHRVPYAGVGVGAIKKHATGKGNAKKPAMIASAQAKWGSIFDDNHADAMWLADLAYEDDDDS